MRYLKIEWRFTRLSLLFLSLFFSISPVFALPLKQAPDAAVIPPSFAKESDISFFPEVGAMLREMDTALEKGDSLAVSEQVQALLEWKKKFGSANLFFATRYMAARAAQFANSGNLKLAVQTLQDANIVSPGDWRGRLALAHYSFRLDKKDVRSYMHPLVWAGVLYFGDQFNQRVIAYRVMRLLLPAALVSIAMFSAGVLFMYWTALVRDVRRIFPFEMGDVVAKAAITLFLLLGGALGGFPVFALLLSALAAAYLNLRGRVMLAIFVMFLAAFPHLLGFAARGVALENSKLERAITDYANGNWEPRTLWELEKAARISGRRELLLALVHVNRMMENYDAAEKYLQKLLALNENDLAAMVEKGNVHFGRGEYREAEILYKKALEAAPKSAEVHYNLSNAYEEQFKTEDAAGEFDIAMQIDKEKIGSMSKLGENARKKQVISLPVNLRGISIENPDMEKEKADMKELAWAGIFGNLGRVEYYIGVGGYAVLVVLSAALGGMYGASAICPSCGEAFKPGMKVASSESMKCNQCLILSTEKQKALGSKKEQKKMQIRAYQYGMRVSGNRLNHIFPGLGGVYRGAYAGGYLMLLCSSVFLVKLASVGLAAVSGISPMHYGTMLGYAAWVCGFFLFYLASVIILRVEE